MLVKLFVLGCPGSGKSTAARYIAMLVRDKGCSTIHINDYEILYEMFQSDAKTADEKFRSVDYGGFDVLDPTVYNKALLQLEQEVQRSYSEGNELIIIEFARDDYSKALKQFSDGFLQDAYFLFFDAQADVCIKRILHRVIHPATKDDHFVPEYIVKAYRHKDNRQYIASGLKTDYGIIDERVKIIDNTLASLKFFTEIARFVENILKQEMDVSKGTEHLPKISVSMPIDDPNHKVHGSQDTEPIHMPTTVDELTES